MERFGSINAILSQLSDESVLTKWLEQYRNTTEYLESVYGIDLTENGSGKDRDGERGSNQSIAQILESLVSSIWLEDTISFKPLSQVLGEISLYAENNPQPSKQSPIVCKIDGKGIPEGIKVRFVVDEKPSDPDEIVWQTIQWTIDGVRVNSNINWGKVLEWLKDRDGECWSKLVEKETGEGCWWYWESFKDYSCQLWVSRSCEKYPPRDRSDNVIHTIVVSPSTEETGTGEIRFGSCLQPKVRCEDFTTKVHVVEVN
ncbi:hypothetical protein QFC24_006635 [Naganishia onofrii]|uniref:Uncharacterized protein n=1 Tax=Naganishia onofrii TaxID=1851511 RepID=A0ACC2WYF2_9TREE|nr:hypothetical protein QFC24_006635 [Naganishia onofrii]